MRRERRALLALAAVAGAAGAVLAAFVLAAAGLIGLTLTESERDTVVAVLVPRLPLLALVGIAAMGLVAWLAEPLYRRWVTAPQRLLEQARVLLAAGAENPPVAEGGPPALHGLAEVLGTLARQREGLQRDMAAQVAQASRRIEEERRRLAALMSELTQSVVVCNLDGRVLLYNNRARLQFRALSDAPALADGAEMIGLGRSIYTVFDRALVEHALENLRERLRRGAALPSTQFVTITRKGQLLRAQMAPVRGVAPTGPDGAAGDGAEAITGFVLMLDNITRSHEEEAARERLLHGLTEGSRGSLANLQAAVEMLSDPVLDAAMRERFLGIAREEAQTMAQRLRDVAAQDAAALATRWPLEEMLGADLVQAAQRRIEAQTGLQVAVAEVDDSLWLKVDSFSLLQMLTHLAQRLRDEFGLRGVALRLLPGAARQARLDLVWTGQAVNTETVTSWEIDPIATGGQSGSLTVRDVVQRHGGEFWFERDRVRHQAFFRTLLPRLPHASAEAAAPALVDPSGARPEYYDFDLFARASRHALDDRPLTELAYTVFDTETTGLDPSGGDEIIQIGATRIVNGRVLAHETFEQLVDPQRSIPAASTAIHGITPAQVAGQPSIGEVLRAFHAYAQDTVLVGHNAAFDMRFLALKERETGLRFEQPVLDTLLLSARLHPNQPSHALEALAQRFGVAVVGRHTALGDASVTAEVFLRLLPLLAAQGIRTLGQARAAEQETYYARLTY